MTDETLKPAPQQNTPRNPVGCAISSDILVQAKPVLRRGGVASCASDRLLENTQEKGRRTEVRRPFRSSREA